VALLRRVRFPSASATGTRTNRGRETRELAANCSLVIRLPGGNLTGQFVAVQGPAPREIALTGGTGRYRNAGGEGTLVEFGNGRGRMTLQVLSLVARGTGA
jgi:hypothetical protein